MSSLKNLTILLLRLSFLNATLAYSGCQIRLFKNSINDNEPYWMYHYNDYAGSSNAPFYGWNDLQSSEARTLSSFRAVILRECDYCIVKGFSAKNYGGKKYEEYVARNGQVNFDFCVKSYYLECFEFPEEEEEEEEEQE